MHLHATHALATRNFKPMRWIHSNMTHSSPRLGEQLLDALDPDQRVIAEHLRGPVSVLAGAGTGKTRVITHRIAHGVSIGAYSPEKVMAVTFTRKAAGEMQARLKSLGVDGVRAATFHSAALAQLSYFWPHIVGGSAPSVLNHKVSVLSQAAESMGLKLQGATLRDVAAEIEWRKVSMLDIDRYAQLFTADVQPRTLINGVSLEQLIELHQLYAQLLEDRRQIDFEDVLILTSGMLQTEPRAAVQVHERYRFFTVDEYQDVSPLQHALLREWLGDRDDLCVVGDASQTIYSFAGASSRYLLQFGREFEHATEYQLVRNYRSVSEIVTVANTLMKDRVGALTLTAQRNQVNPQQQAVSAEWFSDEQDEANAVAHAIAQTISSGIAASDIAVLYRANAQSARVESALASLGISSRVLGAQRFFDRAEVKQAVMMIRAQSKVQDERPLFQIVTDILRSLGYSSQPPGGDQARESWDNLQALLTIVDEQPPGATMLSLAQDLTQRSQVHHEPTVDAVTLSAVHSAKGLEWNVVHLIGMSEGVFPSAYASTEADFNEERRLAYVAFTRAREQLRISGSSHAGKNTQRASRFIAESGVSFSSAV